MDSKRYTGEVQVTLSIREAIIIIAAIEIFMHSNATNSIMNWDTLRALKCSIDAALNETKPRW